MISRETVLMTDKGCQMASDIADGPVRLWTGHRYVPAVLKNRGTQEVVEVLFRGAIRLKVTPDHLFTRNIQKRRAADLTNEAYMDSLPPLLVNEPFDFDEEAYTLGVLYAIGDFQYDRVVAMVDLTSSFMTRVMAPTSTQTIGELVRITYQQEALTSHYRRSPAPIMSLAGNVWFAAGVVDASGSVNKLNKRTIVLDVKKERSDSIRRVLNHLGIIAFVKSQPPLMHTSAFMDRIAMSHYSVNYIRAIIPCQMFIEERAANSLVGMQMRYRSHGDTTQEEVYSVHVEGIEQKYALDGAIMSWAD